MEQLVAIDLVRMTNDVFVGEKNMDAEAMRVRQMISTYFLDGLQSNTLAMRFCLSAVLRLLSPPGMEHRLLMLLGAPINNQGRKKVNATIDIGMRYIPFRSRRHME